LTRNGIPVDAWVQDALSLTASEKMPDRTVPFPKTSDLAGVSIQLRRSGCYGTCPSYSVTIRGDGQVSYRGDRFVSIPGVHTSRIDASEVSTLLDRFRAANFFGLQDRYLASVTDEPSYQLSVRLDGHVKVVLDYVGEWVGMPACLASTTLSGQRQP